jgi:isopentenyldiphosphate isomerase
MGTDEIFDTVDESGRVTGQATRGQVHGNPELIHRSVHIHVFDSSGRLYLQKRGLNKDVQPGRWDTSVGGHVDTGETPDSAAVRETHEELGIEGAILKFLYSYIWRTEIETELVSTYGTLWDGAIKILASELDDGRFWEPAEIESKLGSGKFTPNFEEEFSRLKEHMELPG